MIQMIVVEGMWFVVIDFGRCLNEPVFVASVQMFLFATCSVHNRECSTRLHLSKRDLFTPYSKTSVKDGKTRIDNRLFTNKMY
jgi:hypothetical protein